MIALVTAFKNEHGQLPTTHEINSIEGLPSSKWVQRHGGIINFYRSLGLPYEDARTGARRAANAFSGNLRSQSNDISFSQQLVNRYGESNVHWQSPYNKGETLHRSDFKVFTSPKKFFFVDLFFAKDMNSLAGCLNLKLKKLSKINIDKSAPIYLIACNSEYVNPDSVREFVKNRKTKVPRNIRILHISETEPLIDSK